MEQRGNESGVISLEASITVPVFFFLMLFMYGIIIMFMGRQMISHALLQSADSMALDPYASERIETGSLTSADGIVQTLYDKGLKLLSYGLNVTDAQYFSSSDKWYSDDIDMLEETIENRFLGFFAGGSRSDADELLTVVGVADGFDGLDFSESSVDDGVLTITVQYRQEFLFNFYGVAAFNREMTVKVKLWGV